MKKIAWMIVISQFTLTVAAQNVGIGTTNPSQKLEVNGAIRIGNTNSSTTGAIRWNSSKNDFEGYNGTAWVSLTGGKGGWGDQQHFATENQATYNNLYNSGTSYGSYFGSALSANSDYLLAAAYGDYNAQNGLAAAGTVRLYKKTNGVWPLQAQTIITSPLPANSEHFGSSINIDASTFIVGALGNSSNRGRAYIYTVNAGGQAVLSASLVPLGLQQNDFFGMSSGISGYYALVGAPGKMVGTNSSQGIVYAYRYDVTSGTWLQMGTGLTAPDGMANDFFGKNLSVSGSYAAIAATSKNVNGVHNAGKIYIYHFNGNDWVYSTSLTANNPLQHDKFGTSVFLKGDTLLVGTSQYNGFLDTDGNGKVMIYLRNGNNWVLQTTLTAPDGQKSDEFGCSVHLHNGHIIIGARYAGIGVSRTAGKAYVFSLENNQWQLQSILAASNRTAGDEFGSSVVISGNAAVAGAPEATVNGVNQSGRLYFFYQ